MTSDPSQFAYIDEAGDPSLDLSKQGVSLYYVVTAVLVDQVNNDALISAVNSIRQQYFGSGEMKSSGVGGDTARRQKILTALMNAGVKFCSCVVDKSQIFRDSGLKHKKSFIKYLHGRLYKRLYNAFTSLHIRADEHGSSEFMLSFQEYLRNRYQKTMFDHEDFSFVPSDKFPLVQAADMIGGSLFRIYSGKDSHDLRELLAKGAIIIERWPPSSQVRDMVNGLDEQELFDHLVAQQGVSLARDFISGNEKSEDPDVESQVEALRYLLSQYEWDSSSYTHAQPILEHVNRYRDDEMSLQTFRTNIIGSLRSQGVIIASSSKGYKIPNTTRDIEDFVALVDGQALPYLRRLAKARTHLLLASSGKYDIVHQPQYQALLSCLMSIDDQNYDNMTSKGSEVPIQ